MFGSDPNKKILANFSNAYLRGGSVTIYDQLAFRTDNSNNQPKPVVDFNNANIMHFTLTPNTWANLIGSGWTNSTGAFIQLSLGN